MKNRQNASGFEWKKVLWGIGVGILAVLILTAAGAWLISNEIVAIENSNIVSGIILLAGSMLGSLTAGRREGRLQRSIAVGAGMILFLLAVNLVCFDGALNGLLPGTALLLGGTIAISMIGGANGGRRSKGAMGRNPQMVKLNKKHRR